MRLWVLRISITGMLFVANPCALEAATGPAKPAAPTNPGMGMPGTPGGPTIGMERHYPADSPDSPYTYKPPAEKPRKPQIDPEVEQAKALQLEEQFLSEGWNDLSAGDISAAREAFADALLLQPYRADAHLGTALVRAARGQYDTCLSSLSNGRNASQGIAGVITYNRAVTLSRQGKLPLAIAAINRLLVDYPNPEEVVIDGELTLMSKLTPAQKASIPSLEEMNKTLAKREQALADQRPGMKRWGTSWIDATEVDAIKARGEAEPFPGQLQFMLPDGSPLPEIPRLQSAGDASQHPMPTSRPMAHKLPTTLPGTAVAWRGAAIAVAPSLLLTTGRLVDHADTIIVQQDDGKHAKATLVEQDKSSDLALIQVEGADFPPLPLAEKLPANTTAIAVKVMAFPKPTTVLPDVQFLAPSSLFKQAGGVFVRTSPGHPRTPGAAVLDKDGRLLGIVDCTRDDETNRIPVIPSDKILAFLHGRGTPGVQPPEVLEECIVEVTVVRPANAEAVVATVK